MERRQTAHQWLKIEKWRRRIEFQWGVYLSANLIIKNCNWITLRVAKCKVSFNNFFRGKTNANFICYLQFRSNFWHKLCYTQYFYFAKLFICGLRNKEKCFNFQEICKVWCIWYVDLTELVLCEFYFLQYIYKKKFLLKNIWLIV